MFNPTCPTMASIMLFLEFIKFETSDGNCFMCFFFVILTFLKAFLQLRSKTFLQFSICFNTGRLFSKHFENSTVSDVNILNFCWASKIPYFAYLWPHCFQFQVQINIFSHFFFQLNQIPGNHMSHSIWFLIFAQICQQKVPQHYLTHNGFNSGVNPSANPTPPSLFDLTLSKMI